MQTYLTVPAVSNFCWKVSPPWRPPALPDLNFGPGPLFSVTSCPTESSLVHFTVPPFLTVTEAGEKAMLFMVTATLEPPPPPPDAVVFCFVDDPDEEELLSLPQPAAKRAAAQQSMRIGLLTSQQNS